MSAPLKDAIEALRDTTSENDSRLAELTRARVIAQIRKERRQRVARWGYSLPLAAILIGSAAWAMESDQVASSVRRATELLGIRSPIKAKRLVHPSPVMVRSVPTPSTLETVAPAPKVEQEPATSATHDATVAAKPLSSVPQDSVALEHELELYEIAHRAHFVDKDYGKALSAWDSYLTQARSGRFVLEARYNRALCLLRLGRTQEAKRSLRAFAEGTYGSYRQTDAQTLLSRLDERDAGNSSEAPLPSSASD